jgi:leader peptidase (prepilin peptidase)/N-methyltransferase
MPIDLIVNLFVFFAGMCIGSFLNVCIYRIPAGLSVAYPPSSCPRCDQSIRFYDNIPVISYIILRGRCRSCAAPIAIRYPLVEMLTGLAAWCVFAKHGPSLATLTYFVFIAVLIIITFIDIDHQIIPDILSLPGIPLFLAAGLWTTPISWSEALAGIAIGGGSLLLVALVYRHLTGKDGMGMGDVKLLAMIGAMIGWKGVCFTIFFSSVVGSLVGLFLMMKTGGSLKTRLPFGPFLAIGAVAYVFYGPELIDAYLGLTAVPL